MLEVRKLKPTTKKKAKSVPFAQSFSDEGGSLIISEDEMKRVCRAVSVFKVLWRKVIFKRTVDVRSIKRGFMKSM
jgi:hypothetical protein